ncbi:hypothetical protein GCK32_007595 [Trichostrongylus colubriformis]|uniref:ShKT domain-containing protein n=1 Tax=Trichostrongylus colubriformis TaxID=6319 RepID=A0AAN8FWX3_TRICO
MFYFIVCGLLLLSAFTVEAETSFSSFFSSTKALLERLERALDEMRAKIFDSYGTYWVAANECFDKSSTVCTSLDAKHLCKDEELAKYYCPVTCRYCTPKNITSKILPSLQ